MTDAYLKKPTIAMIAALIVALLFFALTGVAARARAIEQYEGEMILEASVTSTASEVEPGSHVYASVSRGDVFTVTYKLVKNDGMVEGLFTPAYDKDAFDLTSFATDTHYWTLMDSYDILLDPQTSLPRTMSAAEYIADRNSKYAAGEIDDFRLAFLLSYSDVRDPNGTLSDTFITIRYTAKRNLAPDEAISFGFDTVTNDGRYTNAAASGEKLLTLLFRTGEDETVALGADTYSFRVWAQKKYDYRFRAAMSSDDILSGSFYALAWDDAAGRFVPATETDPVSGDSASAYSFEIGTAIPGAVAVKGFRVKRWLSVIPGQEGDPVVAPADAFDAATSVETVDGAYYLAEMVYDLGAGDLNGDGSVTATDLLMMKKYLVDVPFTFVETEEQAWALARSDAEDLFYLPNRDVNGDQSADTRDVVAIREGLATGYGYLIVTDATANGVYRSGAQVVPADAVISQGCQG